MAMYAYLCLYISIYVYKRLDLRIYVKQIAEFSPSPVYHMRHKSHDQHDFILPLLRNVLRQSHNHMKRKTVESHDDA